MTDLFGNVNAVSDKLTIKKITLENYRNIAYKEITLEELGVVFSGNNGIGKTNVLEAVYWALTNQLFNGSAKAEKQGIKPEGSGNEIKTRVKIEFNFENYSFEKVFYELWSKTNEFKGNETAYYINGAVVKQNKQAIQLLTNYLGLGEMGTKFQGTKLKDLDLFALIYNTNFLKVIDYQLLRELIIDMVGEVDFKPIINENPTKYSKLVEPLKQCGMQLETLKVAKRTEIFGNANKKGLNDLINGSESTINNLTTLSAKELDLVAIENAKVELAKLNDELADLNIKKRQSSNELVKDYDLKISNKQLELNTAEQAIRNAHQVILNSMKNTKLESDIKDKKESIEKVRNERMTVTEKINEQLNLVTQRSNLKDSKSREMEQIKATLETLRNDFHNLKNPTHVETLTCPHCNKPFETHLAKEHLEVVGKKLEVISEKGKSQKALLQGLEEGIRTIGNEILELNSKILKLQEERNQIDQRGIALKNELESLIGLSQTTGLIAPTLDLNVEPVITLKKELQDLQTSKDNVISSMAITLEGIQQRIDNITRNKESFEQIISAEQTQKQYLKDAQNERDNLEKLNNQRIECEDIISLIKELEREMFTKLDSKVESVFGENIKFQLFKITLEGTVDTRVCEMLVKDIHGNFINIKNINEGMYPIRATEFISKVKKHYGIKKSFIFVDEMDKLDKNHRHMLTLLGEQILATDCREDSKVVIERKIV